MPPSLRSFVVVGSLCLLSTVSQAGLTGSLTIPSARITLAECQPATFSLGACVNELVERADPAGLTINIAAGNYRLTEPWFVYSRDNIHILGAGNATVIAVERNTGEYDRYFALSVIDSSGFVLQGVSFSGPVDGGGFPLSGQRGIGLCATSGKVLAGFQLSYFAASGFADNLVLIGNTLSADKLEEIGTGKKKLGVGPGQKRFTQFLNKNPGSRACSGAIANVDFIGNQIDTHAPVFYVVPMAAALTSTQPSTKWEVLGDSISKNWSGYRIHRNKIRISKKGGFVAHSAMKLHYIRDVEILSNTIESPDVAAFEAGGAINLASGVQDTLIRGNRIVFPRATRRNWHGINLQNGFDTHVDYGVGDKHITIPVRQVSVQANQFVNTGTRFFDCCSALLKSYCQDLNKRSDWESIEFSRNTSSGPTNLSLISGTSFVSRDEQAWAKVAAVSCRTEKPYSKPPSVTEPVSPILEAWIGE